MAGVPGKDGTSAGIVVFDSMEVVMHMLEDERIVCNANIAN
jgi:hypothetical protein